MSNAEIAWRGDPADILAGTGPSGRDLIEYYVRNVPDWHNNAACKGVDHAVFFPSRGEAQDEAKAICAACPVRTECADYAINDPQLDFGIWGGLSARERKTRRWST